VRIAIIHDWLKGYAGAEYAEQILRNEYNFSSERYSSGIVNLYLGGPDAGK